MSKRISKDEIDRFHDYSIYTPSRTLYMGSVHIEDGEESGTDASMAERLIKGLHILDTSAPGGESPITIIMNNLGGDWYHGMAIYDAIKVCKNHITIRVYGYAMSMGSVILQAADERIMAPNSKLMIHYGSMGMDHTHTKIFKKWAEETDKIDKVMENIYMESIKKIHPEFKQAKLKSMLNFDTILNAQETIDLGLADKVE